MSKAIRWQVPFASISGTKYRVDIYDEQDGTWSGITQLLAGETPFVTDEDSSEDFFCPLRPQTGTLQVCTALPDGGRISLDELLPANNIARPIRLLNLDNSNAIEWQGFLSCEAYSQNYTAIPENLTLSVISVLEAMDSVEVNQNTMTEVMTLNKIIGETLSFFDSEVGLSSFSYIYYSMTDYRIFNAGAEANAFFEEKDIQLLHSLTYSVQGCSCKEIIERLCKFMGWVCREQGTTIYLSRLNETIGWYRDTISNFTNSFGTNATYAGYSSYGMSSLDWRGTDHKIDLRQGANSVKVVAKLQSDDIGIDLPECPIDNLSAVHTQQIYSNLNGSLQIERPGIVAEQNDAYYGNVSHKYYVGSVVPDSGYPPIRTNAPFVATRQQFIGNSFMWGGTLTPNQTKYAGAAFARFYRAREIYPTYPQIQNALYCTFLPNIYNGTTPAIGPKLDPIFSIKTTKKYAARLQRGESRLRITGRCLFIGWDGTNSKAIITDKINDEFLHIADANIQLGVRWGDQVVHSNGSGWESWGGGRNIGQFNVKYKDGGFETTIPVAYPFNGELELAIYPNAYQATMLEQYNVLYEVLITDLSISQEFSDDLALRDGGENNYTQLLNTNFRDDISIDVDWATDNNNQPSESTLLQTDNPLGGLLQTLEYTIAGGSTEVRRPELDLLNRMATYYSVAKRRLELQVAHPTSFNSHIVNLYGFDNHTIYLPLAESRDWRTNECTLTCFEK